MLLGTKKPTEALRRVGLSAGLLPTLSRVGFSHFPFLGAEMAPSNP